MNTSALCSLADPTPMISPRAREAFAEDPEILAAANKSSSNVVPENRLPQCPTGDCGVGSSSSVGEANRWTGYQPLAAPAFGHLNDGRGLATLPHPLIREEPPIAVGTRRKEEVPGEVIGACREVLPYDSSRLRSSWMTARSQYFMENPSMSGFATRRSHRRWMVT